MKRKIRRPLDLIAKYTLWLTKTIVLFQKDVGKTKGSSVLDSGGISYTLKQFNGRNIRGHFHGNHLKLFVPRRGEDTCWIPQQI